jgi:molecular chaperone DnaK
VEIHILQGERPMAKDNKSLGRFHLAGIPPAPARVPQIEVTFDIDANGILNVNALEKGTGAKQSITITGSGNLNRDEIDRMVHEAEMNAEADLRQQDLIEVKNKSEQLIYSTEKTLREAGEKISEASRQSATERIEELRKVLPGEDLDAIQAAFNALESESHAIAEQIYRAASEAADESEREPAGTGARGGDGDDVIDAEFNEEK